MSLRQVLSSCLVSGRALALPALLGFLFLFAPNLATAEDPKPPAAGAPAATKPAPAGDDLPVTVNPQPREAESWQKRHEAINQRAKQGEVDVIFLGDSITQGWEGAGKAVWERHYAKRKAMNAGISGDGTQHVLWRINNGNLEGIKPKVAVLMIGTNNVAGADADDIAEGVATIVARLRTKQPQAKVLLLAIFPRGEKPNADREKINKINATLARMGDNRSVFYLDIGQKFMTDDGTISKEIMPDFLHLSEQGYQRWAEAIEPKLAELLGEKK
jgi:beta-glucosidase